MRGLTGAPLFLYLALYIGSVYFLYVITSGRIIRCLFIYNSVARKHRMRFCIEKMPHHRDYNLQN